MACCQMARDALHKLSGLSPLATIDWVRIRSNGVDRGLAHLVDYVRSREAYAFDSLSRMHEYAAAKTALGIESKQIHYHTCAHAYWSRRQALRDAEPVAARRRKRSTLDITSIGTVRLLNRFCLRHQELVQFPILGIVPGTAVFLLNWFCASHIDRICLPVTAVVPGSAVPLLNLFCTRHARGGAPRVWAPAHAGPADA